MCIYNFVIIINFPFSYIRLSNVDKSKLSNICYQCFLVYNLSQIIKSLMNYKNSLFNDNNLILFKC